MSLLLGSSSAVTAYLIDNIRTEMIRIATAAGPKSAATTPSRNVLADTNDELAGGMRFCSPPLRS